MIVRRDRVGGDRVDAVVEAAGRMSGSRPPTARLGAPI
jgi:hypothetical protein